jgi:hypothetical protein
MLIGDADPSPVPGHGPVADGDAEALPRGHADSRFPITEPVHIFLLHVCMARKGDSDGTRHTSRPRYAPRATGHTCAQAAVPPLDGTPPGCRRDHEHHRADPRGQCPDRALVRLHGARITRPLPGDLNTESHTESLARWPPQRVAPGHRARGLWTPQRWPNLPRRDASQLARAGG